MKLSTKARYGLYIAVILTRSYDTGALSVAEISAQTGVSDKYLEQVFSLLKKGGIVTSQRGAYGGYTLARHPEEISVGDVLRSCEDNLLIVDCLGSTCDGKCSCPSHKLFTNLYDNINQFLDGISLKKLMEDNNEGIS